MNKNRFVFLLFLVSLITVLQAQEPDNHQYFTSYDGVKIAFTDEGKGSPVLLLHGFINSGSSWNKTVLKRELLERRYRVIVPDLRGNGHSDQPEAAEAYKNDAEVKDLVALADHLRLKHYIALGYSRGSIVLAKLLTTEKRITKSILGGMGADFTNPNWDRRMAFADAFSGRAELTEMTEGAVQYAQSIGANLKVLGLLQDYQPVTSKAALSQIKIPVLIVCGDMDLDNGDPSTLKLLIPNSTQKIVKGDHNNTYKQENFSQAVLHFISEDWFELQGIH